MPGCAPFAPKGLIVDTPALPARRGCLVVVVVVVVVVGAVIVGVVVGGAVAVVARVSEEEGVKVAVAISCCCGARCLVLKNQLSQTLIYPSMSRVSLTVLFILFNPFLTRYGAPSLSLSLFVCLSIGLCARVFVCACVCVFAGPCDYITPWHIAMHHT